MARTRAQTPLPACYALVPPGLEAVAAEEIEQDLSGEINRVPQIDAGLLELRTVEDVFLLAWGTDQLTYRAEDLECIRRWTARRANWEQLLRLHHGLRPKPQGRPTYHLVAQMEGHHGYLRRDARKALAQGLAGKLPATWRPVEENAAVEVWLSIDQATAVCGLRLSDRTLRHRSYKREHRPASLRPTVAAALVRLAEVRPGQRLLDPMCGAGTILAEYLEGARRQRGVIPPLGGDLDRGAVRAALVNLRHLGPALLAQWDARRLPVADASVDRLVSNPPFGKQLASAEQIGPLYEALAAEGDRVLKPGGRAVLLVRDQAVLRGAARAVGWKLLRQVPIRVLGQAAVISVWQKPGRSGTMP
jgi:tRNA (guanine6-N2)-methyltransferase